MTCSFFCLGENISKTGQKYYVSERINIKGDDGSFTRYKKSNTGSSRKFIIQKNISKGALTNGY